MVNNFTTVFAVSQTPTMIPLKFQRKLKVPVTFGPDFVIHSFCDFKTLSFLLDSVS